MDLVFEGQADALRRKMPAELSYKYASGFQNPTDDHVKPLLLLDDYAIIHRVATYFGRCATDAMSGDGIFPGDVLVIDRAIAAIDGRVIVAVVNGQFYLRRYRIMDNQHFLVASNPNHKHIRLRDMPFEVWGTAIHNLHNLLQ